MERATYRVLLVVEDPKLLSLLRDRLSKHGFVPQEVRYDDAFEMSPAFGPNSAVVFIVQGGKDAERIHQLANHLYRLWSEQGFVLYIAFHPAKPRDEDIFRLWALDALWKYNAPQQFVVWNQPCARTLRGSVEEIVRALPYWMGEGRERTADGTA